MKTNKFFIVASDILDLTKEDLIDGSQRLMDKFEAYWPDSENTGSGAMMGQNPTTFMRDIEYELETTMTLEEVEIELEDQLWSEYFVEEFSQDQIDEEMFNERLN